MIANVCYLIRPQFPVIFSRYGVTTPLLDIQIFLFFVAEAVMLDFPRYCPNKIRPALGCPEVHLPFLKY